MTRSADDRRVIVCNYSIGTKSCAKGTRAYLVEHPGAGHDRLVVVAKSRSGRWIQKWESIRRLQNFRPTEIPPDHPLYPRANIHDGSHRAAALLERTRAHYTDGADRNAPLEWERCGYTCRESDDLGLDRPAVVRIREKASPDGAFIYYALDDYEKLGDDAEFAVIVETMLDLIRIGAIG